MSYMSAPSLSPPSSYVAPWLTSDNSDGGIPTRLVDLLGLLARVERRGNLSLLPNPFCEPPEAVVKQGMQFVKEYFTTLFTEGCTLERKDVKVVIVGKAGAGKTR